MKAISSEKSDSRWQKTPVANLMRHKPSGNYYARIRVSGKLIWKSMKTDTMSVAKLRLGDFHKKERQRAEAQAAVSRGKMTFADALQTYRERLKGDHSLKQRSKNYREERITALLKSWPELKQIDVSKISKTDCLTWSAEFGKKASPTAFNNTIGTLRMVLDVAIEAGARYDNPAVLIKRKKVRRKLLQLPSQKQFLDLVTAIRKSEGGLAERCADLVEFLAYSGCRYSKALEVVKRLSEVGCRLDPSSKDEMQFLRACLIRLKTYDLIELIALLVQHNFAERKVFLNLMKNPAIRSKYDFHQPKLYRLFPELKPKKIG